MGPCQLPGVVMVCMQAGSASSTAKPGPFTVIRQVVSAGGYRALYRGMVPTLLREVPGSCVMFSVYEASKQAFAKQQVRVYMGPRTCGCGP